MARADLSRPRLDQPAKALNLEPAARSEAADRRRRGYDIREFCGVYGISRSQTYVEIAEGRLKIRKVGRRTLIDSADAEAWWAARAVEPRTAAAA